MKKLFSRRALVRGALIAAIYAVLCLLFAPLSFGSVQVRVSEALTLLPILFPEAIPGLTLGCLISNLLCGAGVTDIIFGTLATLLSALCTYALRKSPVWLAAAPSVLFNALIVGFVLSLTSSLAFPISALLIAAGQLIAVYAVGLPLFRLLRSRLEKIK